jgi:hypothetical protein
MDRLGSDYWKNEYCLECWNSCLDRFFIAHCLRKAYDILAIDFISKGTKAKERRMID